MKFLFLLLPLMIFASEPMGSNPVNFEVREGGNFSLYPPIVYSDSHHRVVSIQVTDDHQYAIELEDGSVWKIKSLNGQKVLSWRVNDPLAITQNTRWFRSSEYRIINKQEETSVEADLFLSPIALGPYSKFIVSINYDTMEIWLSDNTHWTISHMDREVFKNWGLNDYVILGINSDVSFWDSSAISLIINANMNSSARAKQS